MKGIKYSLICGAAASLLAVGGCTRAQARIVPEPPPLDVPAPPPRIVEAVEPEPPPLPAEPQELPLRIPPPKPQAPVQRAAPKPEPPKVETPAPEPPRPAEETRQPQGTLQTTPAGREAQLERSIKDMLARAMTNLKSIDYAALNGDARTQYDQARRFISQAQDALLQKNLVFAETVADKANTLAAQLAGR